MMYLSKHLKYLQELEFYMPICHQNSKIWAQLFKANDIVS